MPEKHVKCQCCGADAALKFTEGVLLPDPRKSEVRVVEVIECPKCGRREQPASLVQSHV
jgi:hypothetical protein